MAQLNCTFVCAAALCAMMPAMTATGQTPNNSTNTPSHANSNAQINNSIRKPKAPAQGEFEPDEECGTVIDPAEAAELVRRHNLIFDQDPGPGPSLRGVSFVPVSFHVIRTSAGAGGIDHVQLCQGIADLNTHYANAGIVFYVQPPIDYIDDDDFYNNIDTGAEIDAMIQTNPVPDTVNVYCTPNLANENGGLCGRASFTTSFPQGVAMSNDCMGLLGVNQSTFAHEVGHFFDLFHTHEDFQGLECVDGSNCATAGDLLCDTPADPNLDGVVDNACAYTGAATDPCNGDSYNPSTVNLMSYSTKLCRNDFTSNQDAKVAGTLAMFRPELIHSSIPASADCNGNEIPDFCETDCGGGIMPPGCALSGTDCNNNTIDDACEIADALAFDCNSNFVPDDCELGPNDCNNNGVPDECDVDSGFSEDCQPNGVPDECELGANDCNNNNVPDECDIAGNFSGDCNNNGVPDECDIADNTSMDCQPNGIPDECELGGCFNQSNYPGPSYLFSDADCNVCGSGLQLIADNFVMPVGTTLSGVQFWGRYLSGSAAIHDQFTIVIRDDNAGLPGAVQYMYGPLEADLKLGVGNDIYEYFVDFPGLTNVALGTHWIEIYNNTAGDAVSWGWIKAQADPQFGIAGSAYSTALPEVWNPSALDDMAVRIFCNINPDNDCNNNGIPDECELAAGDCNNNFELDECETKPDGDPAVAVEQDECDDAMIVCPGFDYVGSNVNAVSGMPYFCGLYYGVQDVYYRYRPAYDGILFVRVEGPPTTWLYALYDGCPGGGGGNEIKCNETDHFQVVIPVEAGRDYYIRIASWGLEPPGNFEMNLVGPPCALNPIDLNNNGIPDECECLADVDGSGTVDLADAAIVGAQQGNACGVCPADVNGDGVVDATDWAIVLNSQGPCPFP